MSESIYIATVSFQKQVDGINTTSFKPLKLALLATGEKDAEDTVRNIIKDSVKNIKADVKAPVAEIRKVTVKKIIVHALIASEKYKTKNR